MAKKKETEFRERTLSQIKSAYVSLMVRTMYNVQDYRKRAGNRIFAFRERGKDMANPLNEDFNAMADELDVLVKETLTTLENNLEKRVSKAVAGLPIIQWLEAVHGIGPRYAGSLVALVLDIEKFATVSKLWSYLGMGLVPICSDCDNIAYFGFERLTFAKRQADRRWDLYTTSHEYEALVKKGTSPDEEAFKSQKVLDVCGANFIIKASFAKLLDLSAVEGNGEIQEVLRDEFRTAGVYLSNKATIETNAEGRKWTIIDPRKGTEASKRFKLSFQDTEGAAPIITIITKGVLCMHRTEVERDSELSVEEVQIRLKAKESIFQVAMRAPSRRYFGSLLLTHTPFGKTTCWKIAGQFVRQGDFYRQHYDKVKARYIERDGDTKSDGHIDNMARRATVKLFLSHFWMMWRRSLDLPIGEIWLQQQRNWFTDGHKFIPPPHKDIYGPFDNNTVEPTSGSSEVDIAAG